MIDALIAGRIIGQPASRTAKNGSSYCTLKIRAVAGNGESQYINVISFSKTAVAVLLALGDGDAITLTGELSVGTYTGKDGTVRPSLDLMAHVVLTEYHVNRKRQAMRAPDPGAESTSSEVPRSAPALAPDELDFNDEIPF